MNQAIIAALVMGLAASPCRSAEIGHPQKSAKAFPPDALLRYCVLTEKGWDIHKEPPRPGAKLIRTLSQEEAAAPAITAAFLARKSACPNSTVQDSIVWEIKESIGNRQWYVAQLETSKNGSGSAEVVCNLTLVWNGSTAPFVIRKSDTPNDHSSEATPSILEPFDVADLDGDGRNEVTLQRETLGLIAYRLEPKGWVEVQRGCGY